MNQAARIGARIVKEAFTDLKPHFVDIIRQVIEAAATGKPLELHPDGQWETGRGQWQGQRPDSFSIARLHGVYKKDKPEGMWPFDEEEEKYTFDPKLLDRVLPSERWLKIEEVIRDQDSLKTWAVPSYNTSDKPVVFTPTRWLVVGQVLVDPDPRGPRGVEADPINPGAERPILWTVEISNNGSLDLRACYVISANDLTQVDRLQWMLMHLVGGSGRKMDLLRFCSIMYEVRKIAHVLET